MILLSQGTQPSILTAFGCGARFHLLRQVTLSSIVRLMTIMYDLLKQDSGPKE